MAGRTSIKTDDSIRDDVAALKREPYQTLTTLWPHHGGFSLGRQHRITPQKFEVLRKFEARPLDVVVTVMATVGRVCVLPQDLEKAIITKHCCRITPGCEAIDSHYLAIALRAESSTRQNIFGNVRGQTCPGIYGPILKGAPVAFPPPREQQEIIAEVERRLSIIQELEAVIEANLTRANRLRQSILSTAFSGGLAVSELEIARRANKLIAH